MVELAGRDATTFAQAQFINDLNGLQPGHWQWSGWLTPKGRTVALFALAKWSDDRIWLLLPDLDPSGLAEALRRFVFRSKVAVTVRDDLVVGGAFAKPERAERNRFVEHDGVAEFDLGTPEMPRLLRVGCPAPAVDDAALQRWRMFDLEHGLPRLGPDQSGQWTPQQLSLERIRGFSVKKGCYPGQEIVARTHFLGKAKRGLALLESDRAIAPGAEVTGDARAVGTVVASAGQDGRHLSLAVMPLDREATPLSVGDSPVGERPLREGLAR
ncbi:YgfZ/GcvT domain-containing protein [Lysobacter zhanggongensis]|uniref:CAF17-like 4Fe-4S cluster assembly/insertion protein YgfZ n=1 Tax=Lysobacter zhanggongensis TaxID=1774951 RepID=UPI00399C7EFF